MPPSRREMGKRRFPIPSPGGRVWEGAALPKTTLFITMSCATRMTVYNQTASRRGWRGPQAPAGLPLPLEGACGGAMTLRSCPDQQQVRGCLSAGRGLRADRTSAPMRHRPPGEAPRAVLVSPLSRARVARGGGPTGASQHQQPHRRPWVPSAPEPIGAGVETRSLSNPSWPQAITTSWFQTKNGRASGASRFIQAFVVRTFQS